MFLRNMKNLYINIRKQDIPSIKYHAKELEKDLYMMQTGGEYVWKKYVEDMNERLKNNKMHINALMSSLQILNYIYKMLSELDPNKINELGSLKS